jgi:hypothetical protein
LVEKEGKRLGENDRLQIKVNVGSMDSLTDGSLDGLLDSALLGFVVMEVAGEADGVEGAENGDWLEEFCPNVGCRVSTSDGAALRFEELTKDDGTTVGCIESSLDGVADGDGGFTAVGRGIGAPETE